MPPDAYPTRNRATQRGRGRHALICRLAQRGEGDFLGVVRAGLDIGAYADALPVAAGDRVDRVRLGQDRPDLRRHVDRRDVVGRTRRALAEHRPATADLQVVGQRLAGGVGAAADQDHHRGVGRRASGRPASSSAGPGRGRRRRRCPGPVRTASRRSWRRSPGRRRRCAAGRGPRRGRRRPGRWRPRRRAGWRRRTACCRRPRRPARRRSAGPRRSGQPCRRISAGSSGGQPGAVRSTTRSPAGWNCSSRCRQYRWATASIAVSPAAVTGSSRSPNSSTRAAASASIRGWRGGSRSPIPPAPVLRH